MTYDEQGDDDDDDDDDGGAGKGKGTALRATHDSRARSTAAVECLFGLYEFVEVDYGGNKVLYPATVKRVKPPAWRRRAQQTLYDVAYADGELGKNLPGEVKSKIVVVLRAQNRVVPSGHPGLPPLSSPGRISIRDNSDRSSHCFLAHRNCTRPSVVRRPVANVRRAPMSATCPREARYVET